MEDEGCISFYKKPKRCSGNYYWKPYKRSGLYYKASEIMDKSQFPLKDRTFQRADIEGSLAFPFIKNMWTAGRLGVAP